MKIRAATSAVALAIVGGAAQGIPTYGSPSSSLVSYMIMMDDCPNVSTDTVITVTSDITVTTDITVTYCPECQISSGAGTAIAAPHSGTASTATTAGVLDESLTSSSPTYYTTVYTTTYLSLCPSDITTGTYTITASCTDKTPTWTMGPSHISPGFTVTTVTCDVCDTTPIPVTITVPCGCDATEGITSTASPAQQTSDNQAQLPTPSSNGGSQPYFPSRSEQTPGSSVGDICTGTDCPAMSTATDSAQPYALTRSQRPPGPSIGDVCTATVCPATSTAAATTTATGPSGGFGPAISGNTSSIVPYEGKAVSSTSRAGVLVTFALGVVVGGLAVAL